MSVIVEAAVESLDDALAAVSGGADRLELCADLDAGGTTPSAALIAAVRERVELPVVVMIRPRGGDFVYSDDELSRMYEDVAMARSLGASGVVLGVLDTFDRLDLERTAALVEAAEGIPVTFHRAIDRVARRVVSIDALAALGVARVLSSGGAETASDGVDELRAMVKRAADRLTVVAGGGVRAHNAREIVAKTGVTELHARCAGDSARIRGIVDAVNTHDSRLSNR
jgi:copper homeostasis protein